MQQLSWLWLPLLLLVACSRVPESPEQSIRELIGQGETAAEERDRDFFAEVVSPDYSDVDGRNRRDLLRMVTGYFLRNRSIHLLLQIEEIQLLEGEKAQAVLYVGMAGSPAAGFEQLFALRAAVYRMELTFQLDAEIRLLQASWRRADPEEVLPTF